jgi:hypothetical protein
MSSSQRNVPLKNKTLRLNKNGAKMMSTQFKICSTEKKLLFAIRLQFALLQQMQPKRFLKEVARKTAV